MAVMAKSSKTGRQGGGTMNALDKTIAIIEAFLAEGDELRLSELARITGMNKSTTYVIAQALVARGYLTQSEKRGSYFLGLRFIELANAVQRKLSVVDTAMPLMTALAQEVGDTVELAVRDGAFCAIVASVKPNRMLAASGTGKWAARVPLHNTACGKILAAYMPPGDWQELRSTLQIVRDTPKTIASLAAFETHLAKVRAEGLAIDDEEAEIGIRSISAPVYNSGGHVIAALLVIGPKSRLTNAQMTEYKPLVRNCAQRISRGMGYTR
jgi:IclR family transcriptional regulator, KDG regulon repressor